MLGHGFLRILRAVVGAGAAVPILRAKVRRIAVAGRRRRPIGEGRLRRLVCPMVVGWDELDIELVNGQTLVAERCTKVGEGAVEQVACLGGRDFEAGGNGALTKGNLDLE